MNKLIVIALAIALQACSAVSPRATATLVRGTEDYCANVSLTARKAIRDQVNSELASRATNKEDPPKVCGVHCPGDSKESTAESCPQK